MALIVTDSNVHSSGWRWDVISWVFLLLKRMLAHLNSIKTEFFALFRNGAVDSFVVAVCMKYKSMWKGIYQTAQKGFCSKKRNIFWAKSLETKELFNYQQKNRKLKPEAICCTTVFKIEKQIIFRSPSTQQQFFWLYC